MNVTVAKRNGRKFSQTVGSMLEWRLEKWNLKYSVNEERTEYTVEVNAEQLEQLREKITEDYTNLVLTENGQAAE